MDGLKRIIVKINGTVVVDYTVPEHPKGEKDWSNRVLNGGTFALQAHDFGIKLYGTELYLTPQVPEGRVNSAIILKEKSNKMTFRNGCSTSRNLRYRMVR